MTVKVLTFTQRTANGQLTITFADMNRTPLTRLVTAFCCFIMMFTASSAHRILYIGDSITDGGWGRSGGSAKPSNARNLWDQNHIYGQGYVMLCAAYYQSRQPNGGWTIMNRGISGNTLQQMAVRWDEDALSLNPDIISILIGTNDVGAYEESCKKSGKDFSMEGFDFNGWETQYRRLMDNTIQARPGVKIVLCTPFAGKSCGAVRCAITDSLAGIVRRIAADCHAVCVSFDRLFAGLQKSEPSPKHWIWDGIHPTAAGHEKMAELWRRCAEPLIGNRVTIDVPQEELEKSPAGPYEATWKSMEQNYRTPQWFEDAKFGIFIHWGLYSVPAQGSEWYPRHMYNGLSGSHRQKWGDQKDFGYKDFIPMFKAERFDAKEWAELFREAGARYVIPTAEHHDGFAMYDSKLTKWNARQMGPKRDIIGELSEAVRAEGMKFGVSNHRIENWDFMYPDRIPIDSTDLAMPEYATFYGPPQLPTAQSGMGPKALTTVAGDATEAVIDESAEEGRHPQSDAFLNEWQYRIMEIIDKYRPDLLYFDNGINYRSLDPWKLRIARYYYNSAWQWKKEVSIQSKSQAYIAGSIVDFERESRAPRKPYGRYWQVDDPIGNKFGYVEGLKLQSADGIIRNLVDNVACGGNLCLNISPKSDGTIPEDQRNILLTIGQWLHTNGEGIYGTCPYRIFGEGPRVEGHRSEANIRFTQKGDTVYAFVMKWNGKPFTIHSIDGKKVKRVTCLANGKRVKHSVTADGLHINATMQASNSATGFRIETK